MTDGKKNPQTLWRLVEAKCSQLKDTVASARISLFALMAWTFAMFVVLYNHELGYPRVLIDRLEAPLQKVASGMTPCEALMDKGAAMQGHGGDGWLGRYHSELTAAPDLPKESQELCLRVLTTQHAELLKEQIRSWQFSVPAMGGSLYVFDIGTAGYAGLLMLLLWFYFATRRENHAIRSFVEIEGDALNAAWLPSEFTLKAKDPFLSAEHYCFAYHAVAQRFMFLFSSRVGPILWLTMALIFSPLILCLWNSWTDVRDLLTFSLGQESVMRTLVSVVMFTLIIVISVLAARHTVQSSVLLNGWFLAARDVWLEDWDETNEDPAPKARISRAAQTATKVIG